MSSVPWAKRLDERLAAVHSVPGVKSWSPFSSFLSAARSSDVPLDMKSWCTVMNAMLLSFMASPNGTHRPLLDGSMLENLLTISPVSRLIDAVSDTFFQLFSENPALHMKICSLR